MHICLATSWPEYPHRCTDRPTHTRSSQSSSPIIYPQGVIATDLRTTPQQELPIKKYLVVQYIYISFIDAFVSNLGIVHTTQHNMRDNTYNRRHAHNEYRASAHPTLSFIHPCHTTLHLVLHPQTKKIKASQPPNSFNRISCAHTETFPFRSVPFLSHRHRSDPIGFHAIARLRAHSPLAQAQAQAPCPDNKRVKKNKK
ncbi:hypothetical protein GQ44DRAFT_21485 [Phaeosphaeriaceae sp. PMI808]|nr:hypothetical protein GQ44DRAFT_21485 [Phaeosphaeriaceae sp. PMI808]